MVQPQRGPRNVVFNIIATAFIQRSSLEVAPSAKVPSVSSVVTISEILDWSMVCFFGMLWVFFLGGYK